MATRKKRQRRMRGSGRIRKTGENQYSVGADLPRATSDAKRRTKYATVHGSMDDAKRKLRELQREVDKGAFDVADDALTMNDLLDRYLQAKALSKEGTTVAWYERHYRTHVRPAFGTKRLVDLKAAHVQSLLSNARNQSRTKKRGEQLNGQSLRNLLICVRASLAWAVRQGLVVRNVADLVEPPSLPHSEPVVVGLENVRAIIAAVAGSELEAIVPFLIGTGLRRSEACGLRWSDIDFNAGTVRVQRSAANLRGKVIIKACKTPRSRRTEYLAPFVLAVLRKHHAAQAERHLALGIGKQGPDAPVFDRYDGRAWDPNELSRKFTRMRQAKKLPPIRLHDLRHGFATLSFAAGVSLKAVSESLGHSNINVTAGIYVHLLSETKRNATDAFEAYVSAAVTPLPEASSE